MAAILEYASSGSGKTSRKPFAKQHLQSIWPDWDSQE